MTEAEANDLLIEIAALEVAISEAAEPGYCDWLMERHAAMCERYATDWLGG